MTKILVVDDETDLEILIKQKFRQKIREQQYEFIFAENGRRALEQLEQHTNVDLVLSDINMPEMDGLSLLSKLNDDFITKPIDFTDLELTIEKTVRHISQIRETLKAIKENNILKMYVDEGVLNFMGTREFELSLLASETVEASVAFIDICGFTAISENETPDNVVKLLNTYFDVMVKEIIAQGGFVDKFIGDAIMAVFRGNHHLDRAIEACLAVRAEIAKLTFLSEIVSYKPNVSIGINCGELVSGNIGSASLRRLDYTVIGDVVNTASRLQSVAKPGQVIISENSYEQVKEFFNCRKVGEVSLKNKVNPMVIYEVIE